MYYQYFLGSSISTIIGIDFFFLQVGSMGAEGYCVNVPWSRGGVGDNDYLFAFQHVVLPIGCYSIF